MAKSKGTRPDAPRSIGAVLETPPRVDLGSYFLKHTILPPQDSEWLLVRPEGQSVLVPEDLIGPSVSSEPDLSSLAEKNATANEETPADPVPSREEPVAEVAPDPSAEPSPGPAAAESGPGETAALPHDPPSPQLGGEGGRDTAKESYAPAEAKEAIETVTEPPARHSAPASPPAPESVGSARESLVRGGVEEMVVFSIGGQLFGTEILKVKEIIRMPEPTPTPQAPPFVRGIVNLRGAVVPVVEMRDLLGMPGAGPSKKPYLMIAKAAGLTMGVIVDGISRVIKISGESLEEYQGRVLGSGSGEEAVWGVVKEGDSLVSLIDLDAVFQDPRFHALRS